MAQGCRLRLGLRVATSLLVLGVGWVWGGSAGAALCFLWWRTPSFANAWHYSLPSLAASKRALVLPSTGASWLCPWFMLRRPLPDTAVLHKANRPALEIIYRDEVGAAEFARLRRQWLGRAD